MAGEGRFQVLHGTIGTITADGTAVYHRLGDLVDLTNSEAERLLGLHAVADRQASKPAAPKPAESTPKG